MSDCKRIWEVEAARDGRLTGNERLSIERHVVSCSICAGERQRLDTLAARLRDLPVYGVGELSLRRKRYELLARAREQHETPPARRRAVWLGSATLIGAAAVSSLWFWSSWTDSGGHRPRVAALALRPDSGARYTKDSSDRRRDIVHLLEGRLTLEVSTTAEHKGVLVRTPDGEIEDQGTIFSVTVQNERTELISVVEGRVIARLKGKGERWIDAGEMHRPYSAETDKRSEDEAPAKLEEATRAKRGRSTQREAEEPLHKTSARSHAGASSNARTKIEHAGQADSSQQGRQEESAAETEFARAVAHVEAHDDARAGVLLEQFVARFPDDARAQDAAFLGVVIRARRGDGSALRIAARAYLARYPRGFRVPEVLRLLEGDAGATSR
jgi:hypothetical protein